MLRVTTLYASSAKASASYYTQYLVDSPGEEPGRWFGDEAERVGVCGTVAASQLEAVLEGRHPVNGSPLGAPFTDRVKLDGSTVRAVTGFDATFSAPKSVSVVWALTADPRVLEAHDVAVYAALAHLERFGSTTRVRRDGGRMHVDSGGVIAAAFRQTTSRAGDPQLHTHAVISAKVRTADGRWRALDARYLKRRQRMLGGIYQSVLRTEMVHRFGVEWRPVVNGQAELAAVPEELLELFSKRARQVEAALAAKVEEFIGRQGRVPNMWEKAALTREAAADSRARKTAGHSDPHIGWRGEAERAGHDLTPVAVVLAGRSSSFSPDAVLDGHAVIEALSVKGSTWARADVMQAVCDAAPALPVVGERWASELERMTDEVIARCVNLDPASVGPARASDGRSVWIEPIAGQVTSPEILAEEERLIAWALDTTLDGPLPATKHTIASPGLDVLQSEAATAVAGDARLVIVVGPAGTGKTTMLRAAHAEMRHQRRDRVLFGVAPSAKAARVLESETGITSDTVAKLLHEWSRTDRRPEPRYLLPPGATIVVDEAGMTSTPALTQLVTLAEAQRWRLVLVGDPAQLQAVGRGGMFGELCRAVPVFPLDTIHRFAHQWEADTSIQLRQGDPAAIDAYVAHGRVHPGALGAHIEAITRTWIDHQVSGRTCAVTVSSNEHAQLVNRAIQNARHLDSTVAAEGSDGQVFIGDVIATRRNDRTLVTDRGEPVRNRDLWTVTAISPDGSITARQDRGSGLVVLRAGFVAEHVQLGYAVTEHGNQGVTTDHAVALVSSATTRRGLYVAATRGRRSNDLHVVTEQPDLGAATEVMRAVLASDRADVPAVVLRRHLAGTRHETPVADTPDLAGVRNAHRSVAQELAALNRVVEHLQTEVSDARLTVRNKEREMDSSGILRRRAARGELEQSRQALGDAESRLELAIERRRPVIARQRELATLVLSDRAAARDPGQIWMSLRDRQEVVTAPGTLRRPDLCDRDPGLDLGL